MPATDSDQQKIAVLLLGHGSRLSEANDPLREVAAEIRETGRYDMVEAAFLQLAEPDIPTAVDTLASAGATSVIVMPYFLYMGAHVRKDIPVEVEAAKERYPHIEFLAAANLGFHPSLVEITLERLKGAEPSLESASLVKSIHQQPKVHPIEEESFQIIASETNLEKFPEDQRPVIQRVIHTTADFGFEELLEFSPHAVSAGVEAVSNGANVITDVRMVEVGVSAGRLKKFGGTVRSFSSDPEVNAKAREAGTTKTAYSMRLAAPHMEGGIAAIGNAPTALRELLKLIREGKASPALVIGTPVGFVGAEEAKEELAKSGIEYITTRGRKGGSTVAVAIVNAIILSAARKAAEKPFL